MGDKLKAALAQEKRRSQDLLDSMSSRSFCPSSLAGEVPESERLLYSSSSVPSSAFSGLPVAGGVRTPIKTHHGPEDVHADSSTIPGTDSEMSLPSRPSSCHNLRIDQCKSSCALM